MDKKQMDRARRALDEAKQKAGTSAELARLLGITPQAISDWEITPPLRVLPIEEATGVTRYDLRPDVYPEPESE